MIQHCDVTLKSSTEPFPKMLFEIFSEYSLGQGLCLINFLFDKIFVVGPRWVQEL